MKTKKVTFLTAVLLLLAGVTLTFTGCEHDYYDPSRQKGTGSSLFGDSINIPAGFGWETTRTVDLRVKVEDNHKGAYYYIVEIFDANPLFDENAGLLGMGVSKNNSDFMSKLVIPEAVNTVYIQQTSPSGGKTIAPVEVSSTINYSFGATATPTASTLRSASTEDNDIVVGMSTRATTDPYPMPTLPANHTVVTQTGGELSSNIAGDAYLITGNFSGTTNFWKRVDIFVQGTLNVTGNLLLPPGSRLIVMPGASVTTKGINAWGETNSEDLYIKGTLTVNDGLNFQKNSKLVVFEGGNVIFANGVNLLSNTVMYNNGTVQVSGLLQTSNTNAAVVNNHIMTVHQLEITQNSGLYTNNGTLTVNNNLRVSNNGKVVNNNTINSLSLTLDNGTFENEGVVTVSGQTSATNGTTLIRNNNRFITGSLHLQGHAQVENNCHMIVQGLLNATDVSIINAAGGLLSTTDLFMENTRIELGSAAMMKVTAQAVYKYNTGSNGFYGTGANMALLQITKAIADASANLNLIHYEGNLMIECNDHPKKANNRYTENGVTWAGKTGSNLVIPATECNDGGYSNVPSTPPSNPVFPIIWNGTDVTYLFEDGWPLLGDYDMNDVVLNVIPEYTIDAGNKVSQLKLDVTLRAVGGIKRLAVGMQLDGITPNSISSVVRINDAGRDNSVFPASSNGLEPGQTYAVLPIFDDVHKAIGIPAGTMINTIEGGSVSPVGVSFVINFTSPVNLENVSIQKLNPFIVNGGYKSKRDEVHMPGFPPTDKADRRRFGAGDDNSNSSYYTSHGNLIWGLAIPSDTFYPKEYISIRQAYPELENWAINAGSTAKDWYLHPKYSLIYQQ